MHRNQVLIVMWMYTKYLLPKQKTGLENKLNPIFSLIAKFTAHEISQ
jgi:hypothetical protein